MKGIWRRRKALEQPQWCGNGVGGPKWTMNLNVSEECGTKRWRDSSEGKKQDLEEELRRM